MLGVMDINISIISTGDEITEGDILNITSKEISNILTTYGLKVKMHINVSDNKDDIISALNFLSNFNDIIIITGGLGSTADDLTREAVSEFLNSYLVFNNEVYQYIINRYKIYGKIPNRLIKKQAYVIPDSIILKNEYGSAPGMLIKKDHKKYILLPGPPLEAISMFKNNINLFLNLNNITPSTFTKIQFYNISESNLMSLLEDKLKYIKYSTKLELNIGPSIIFKEKNEKTNEIIDYIYKNMNDYIVPNDPIKYLIETLSQNRYTISTAESCTGGLIGKLITDIPGSSKVYMGSIVAYSNKIKNKILNINDDILENDGAVSEKTVRLMAINSAKILESDFSIAISGFAGPNGGTKENPVGTIYFSFFDKKRDIIYIEKKLYSGTRGSIREKCAYYAIIRFLKLFFRRS